MSGLQDGGLPAPDNSSRAAAVLQAVAYAVRELAHRLAWRDAAATVLERLGEATGASRVYIFENSVREDGELLQSEIFEWVAPGISTTIDDPENQDLPYSAGFERYRDELSAGRVVSGPAGEFSEAERADLATEDILSVAFVPISVGEDWWGYLGFDDCRTPRGWSSLEIQALRAAADAFGSAIVRDRLHAQILEAEKRWRELIENVPAILYIDLPSDEFITAYVSPQLETVLGVTQRDWIDIPDIWERHLHPDDKERVVREYELYLKKKAPGVLVQEYRFARPDGEVRWIRDECNAVVDEHDQVKLVEGVMYDVTSQKRVMEAFREAQDKYRTLIEQIPAITYLDPVDENEASMYVSPQVETVLGCSPERWLNDPSWWHNHIHPDDEPRVWTTYVKHREASEPLSQEYRMVRDDGRTVWIREEATLLRDETGAPWVVQGLMYDITARKRAEEATLRAVSAERSNRAKDEFLSRVSHELRTPMNAILGFAQLLDMEDLSEGQRESVREIRSAGDHLFALINDVLAISSASGSAVETLEVRPVALAPLIEDVLASVAGEASERGIEMVAGGGPPDLHALADPERIRRVLADLVTNAVRYNRHGGDVVVSFERDDAGVKVSVRDTGPGISEDSLGRLFVPFQRLGAERTSVQGTGLGLALAKRLVEAMGGEIGVQTAEGEGSTFWFRLPMPPAEA